MGPLVFRKQDAPLYIPGFTVVIVANVLSILLMLLYRFLNARENKKRDQIAPESFDNAFDDDLTDLKVCARHLVKFDGLIRCRILNSDIGCRSILFLFLAQSS